MAGTIVAMGGVTMGPADGFLHRYLLDLCGTTRPRVCLLATASGDDPAYVDAFHRWFPASACRASHLPLFLPPFVPPDEHLAEQDVVYVSGGSTRNMLAVWRLHGIDRLLADAWGRGAVLAGASAGSLCWFASGLVQTLAGGLAPTDEGLGLVDASHAPHYGDGTWRDAYRRAVARGVLPGGWGVDDGAALVVAGDGRTSAVTGRRGATAHRVDRRPGGWVDEPLPAHRLGRAMA